MKRAIDLACTKAHVLLVWPGRSGCVLLDTIYNRPVDDPAPLWDADLPLPVVVSGAIGLAMHLASPDAPTRPWYQDPAADGGVIDAALLAVLHT